MLEYLKMEKQDLLKEFEAVRKDYEAMRALHIAGNPIDLMTLGNELTKRGTLESVGGAAYLLQAVRFVPTTANTRTYIEIVLEKATLRRLISASQQISQQCGFGSTTGRQSPT